MSVFVRQTFPDEDSLERREASARLQAVSKDLEWWRVHYQAVSQWLFAETHTQPLEPTTPSPTMGPTKNPPQPLPTEDSGSTRVTSSLLVLVLTLFSVMNL